MEKQGNQIPPLWTLFGCLQICQFAYEPIRTSSGHAFCWYIHKTFYNILDIFCELTSNMSAQNLSLWAHQQIDIFKGIQKEFIAAVFDSLASPTNLPCHLSSNSGLLLSRHRLDTLLEKNNKLYTWRPREVGQPRQLPWLEFLTNAKGNLWNALTLLPSLSVYLNWNPIWMVKTWSTIVDEIASEKSLNYVALSRLLWFEGVTHVI